MTMVEGNEVIREAIMVSFLSISPFLLSSATMELPAVGEPNDARKLMPTSSRRWAKRMKGVVTKSSLCIHPSSIRSSMRTMPITVGGIMDMR